MNLQVNRARWLATFIGAALIQHGASSDSTEDPFQVIDPQNWANPDNMTWDDWRRPKLDSYLNIFRSATEREFKVALVAVDYPDRDFIVTQPANSTKFGNPLPEGADIPRKKVTKYYKKVLNDPSYQNRWHTLSEYWMEDSHGKYKVDLQPFGPYQMPEDSYRYNIYDSINPKACPEGTDCSQDIRRDALELWREDVGDRKTKKFEMVFILTAGPDNSISTKKGNKKGKVNKKGKSHKKGKSKKKEDTAKVAPPRPANATFVLPDVSRFVPWTSWAEEGEFWYRHRGGSSVQFESSGVYTYAHELSFLLGTPETYDDNDAPETSRRSFTGPWSRQSRGSFNGLRTPSLIPPVRGGAKGSLHTIRDRLELGLTASSNIVTITRDSLKDTGPLVMTLVTRSVASQTEALRIQLPEDLSPECDIETDIHCDGGSYDNYDVEVIDRTGADSFQADSGVLISKTKNAGRNPPLQWVIDANPQDIKMVDFRHPNGSEAMVTMNDGRQLLDALFHAGTRSGSKFEYKDEANGLHFYIIGRTAHMNGLRYSIGVRALDSRNKSRYGVKLDEGVPLDKGEHTPTGQGVFCQFVLTNNGSYTGEGDKMGERRKKYMGFDIYRLQAMAKGEGWRVEVRNPMIAVKFGEKATATIAIGATEDAVDVGYATLTAMSESDPEVQMTARCKVDKHLNDGKKANRSLRI